MSADFWPAESETLRSWLEIYDSYRPSPMSAVMARLSSHIVRFFEYINQMDLSSTLDRREDREKATKYYFSNRKRCKTLLQKTYTKFHIWGMNLVGATSLVFVYAQIVFSWRKIQLERSTGEQMKSGAHRGVEVQNKANPSQNCSLVNLFGPPLLNSPYFLELHILYLILTGMVVFNLTHLFNRLSPLDISGWGFLVERKLYMKFYVKVVIEEINKFLASNKNFNTNIRNEQAYLLKNSLIRMEKFVELRMKHEKFHRTLKKFLLMGEFLPIHRRPRWNYMKAAGLVIYISIIIVYGCIFATSGIFYLIPLIIKPVGLVKTVEALFYFAYVSFEGNTAVFNLAMMSTMSAELIHYTNEINKKLEICISLNDAKLRLFLRDHFGLKEIDLASLIKDSRLNLFDYHCEKNLPKHLKASRHISLKYFEEEFRLDRDRLVDNLNSSLVYVLIQYKVFYRLLKQPIESIGMLAFNGFVSVIWGMILLGAGVELVEWKRMYSVGLMSYFSIIVLAENLFLPICNVNKNSTKIMKTISKLLCHSLANEKLYSECMASRLEELDCGAEDDEEAAKRDGEPEVFIKPHGHLFDGHLMWQMRKELEGSLDLNRRGVQGTTIKVLGRTFSYSTFLRWHVITTLVLASGIVTRYYKEGHQIDHVPSFKLSIL